MAGTYNGEKNHDAHRCQIYIQDLKAIYLMERRYHYNVLLLYNGFVRDRQKKTRRLLTYRVYFSYLFDFFFFLILHQRDSVCLPVRHRKRARTGGTAAVRPFPIFTLPIAAEVPHSSFAPAVA